MPVPPRLLDEAVTVARRPRLAAAALAVLWMASADGRAQTPAVGPSPATLRIGVTQADGRVVPEEIALDDYVARVLSGEGQPKAAPAAQEALAIVIRTFALANRNRHRAEGYDLCDTTHCQVMRPVLPAAAAAASATTGRVLLDRGRPAFVFYSANDGGRPALASEVWPGAVDYAPGEPDDVCGDEPGWTTELTAAEAERTLRAAGLAGRVLRALSVADRTPSGRAGRLRAEGFTPDTVAAHEFRMAAGRVLGWQRVRSTAFDITATATGYRLSGVGYGHGVGLCVVGAGKRAARGQDTAAILKAYFRDLVVSGAPGTTTARAVTPAIEAPRTPPLPRPVVPAPPVAPAATLATDIRLTLPAFEEHDRALVLGLARRTRDDIAQRALVAAPDALTITVHPSMDAFGRATGQPWWVTGATVGTTIDLAPIAHLRERGVLESTIRFEVASAVVQPHLASSPAWVKVGAAMFYAAGDAPAGALATGRVACPSDAELLQPVSGGAQREARLRAERCVRREMARGRRLTELR